MMSRKRNPVLTGLIGTAVTVVGLVLLFGVCARTAGAMAPAPGDTAWPSQDYFVLVASEAVDQVALVRFGPGGATVVRTQSVGVMLADPDGPHGVAVSPDQRHYYVTTAHGLPFGTLWKYDARSNAYLGKVTLGNFPATAQVAPDGETVWVVNFNLHGEMVPSDVSVVRTSDLLEIARIPTCTMPHGSRLAAAGTRHYSACMMDDLLVEIDARTLEVARHFHLGRGRERGVTGAPPSARHAHGHASSESRPDAAHDASATGTVAAPSSVCSPTWAQPSPDGRTVWVACNGTSDVVEIDATSFTLRRRLPARAGVYNLAVTHDGTRLLATNKRDQSVSVFDVRSGRELARVPTARRVVHGVVVSHDDRYAFVSVEGVGSEPGTVECIDLATLTTVARVDVGQMAGGIDVLRPAP